MTQRLTIDGVVITFTVGDKNMIVDIGDQHYEILKDDYRKILVKGFLAWEEARADDPTLR